MIEVTKENHAEVFEALRHYYIKTIQDFVSLVGGLTKASELSGETRWSVDMHRTHSMESLKKTYEAIAKLNYEIPDTMEIWEFMKRTGMSKYRIINLAAKGKLKRLSARKPVFERQSAEILIADIIERKKIMGIK